MAEDGRFVQTGDVWMLFGARHHCAAASPTSATQTTTNPANSGVLVSSPMLSNGPSP